MKQIKLTLLISTALLSQNLKGSDATPPKKGTPNAWGSRGAGRGRGQGASGSASSSPEQMVMGHSPLKVASPDASSPEAGVAAPGGISPADPVACAHVPAAVSCAGAGAGAGAGAAARAGETDGFEMLSTSRSASPTKEAPRATWVAEPDLVFTGAQPDIRDIRGEYKPNMLAGLAGYNFIKVLENLKNGKPLVDREVEKTFSEMSDGLIDPKTAATITTGVEKTGIPINLHYWGNAFNYHEDIKTAELAALLKAIRETGTNIRTAKAGVVSALTGHSKQSGSGRTSPVADYGMGPRFKDNEEEAAIQLVRKAFALERAQAYKAAEAAKAAGITKK